jgi:hypothetical protein
VKETGVGLYVFLNGHEHVMNNVYNNDKIELTRAKWTPTALVALLDTVRGHQGRPPIDWDWKAQPSPPTQLVLMFFANKVRHEMPVVLPPSTPFSTPSMGWGGGLVPSLITASSNTFSARQDVTHTTRLPWCKKPTPSSLVVAAVYNSDWHSKGILS